jgi:CubicO group peptidase (beta-lactamase class C family)
MRLVPTGIKAFLLASCMLSGPAVALADPSSPPDLCSRVEEYMAARVQRDKFSGAVLIARAGHVVFCKGYGMANLELDVACTPKNLLKWDRALDSEKLVSSKSLDAMHRPFTDGYGYGWSIDRMFGQPRYTHGGGIPGFVTIIERFPAEKLLVVGLFQLNDQPKHEAVPESETRFYVKTSDGLAEFVKGRDGGVNALEVLYANQNIKASRAPAPAKAGVGAQTKPGAAGERTRSPEPSKVLVPEVRP